MPRNRVADLHLRVPQYSAMEGVGEGLRTPSIASTVSHTHRPAPARTMSSASMMSSDGDDAMEADWTGEQEELLLTTYNAEIGTYSHQNPPFVPSAPPPALLSRVAKKVIKQARDSWPHTLAQTRKHLLLLVRRHAPEPESPHVAPQQPATNRMSVITNDLPGYFTQSRGRPASGGMAQSPVSAAASALAASAAAFLPDHTLNSPFDERSFNFDRPVSPRRTRMSASKSRDISQNTPRKLNRPDLLKEGSFGFGVPLTPSRQQSSNSRRSDRSKTPTRRRHDLAALHGETIDEGVEEMQDAPSPTPTPQHHHHNSTPTTRGRLRSSIELTPTAARQLDLDGGGYTSNPTSPTLMATLVGPQGSPRRSSRIRDKTQFHI